MTRAPRRKGGERKMRSEFRAAIAATNEKFIMAVGLGDAAGMAAVYTENGRLLPPNSDFITGKSAIQTFWQGVLNMGIKAVKLETVELEGHDDTAIEVGKYALMDGGGKTLDTGKYVVVWKRELGQWRWHRDIWNSSMPAR